LLDQARRQAMLAQREAHDTRLRTKTVMKKRQHQLCENAPGRQAESRAKSIESLNASSSWRQELLWIRHLRLPTTGTWAKTAAVKESFTIRNNTWPVGARNVHGRHHQGDHPRHRRGLHRVSPGLLDRSPAAGRAFLRLRRPELRKYIRDPDPVRR